MVEPATAFSSRLELKTSDSDFTAIDAYIKRTIEDNNLSDSTNSVRETNRRVYFVSCSRQGMNLLLADMDSNIWDKLTSARLFVQTDVFSREIAINEVTTEQIAKIAGQQSYDERIEVAKDISVLNNMVAQLPGGELLSDMQKGTGKLITIPQPFFTSRTPKPAIEDKGEKTIRMTIVIAR
jgi:hypothetical protein